jgi:pimeloyl-ACP methyl ester carboxylesterase
MKLAISVTLAERATEAVLICREAPVEHRITAADGRTLAIQEAGDPDGKPVLAHNGTPNSRQIYAPVAADAAARGIRLISYDRPGYGESDPQPGRTVASCAGDVRDICAALGISRLATWGVSGGGPHVLACAALLPDLVAAAASLASLAPYPAPGLDWFDGMGQEGADDFRALLTDDQLAADRFEQHRAEALAATADTIAGTMEDFLTPPDAAVLTGDLAEYAVGCDHDGLAPGSQGWHDDNRAHISPWGFSLSDIRVPVLIMHGRHDQFVPFTHGQWLAARIPGAEARLLSQDGHLTLTANRLGEVHAWLADQSTLHPGRR